MSQLFNYLKIALTLGLTAFASLMQAQNQLRLTGKVIDANSSLELPFATLAIDGASKGHTTDEDGFFKVSVKPGSHTLLVKYIGYSDQTMALDIHKDTEVTVRLVPAATKLDEVVVEDEGFYGEREVLGVSLSTNKVDAKQIDLIPSLAGEADLIKVIQLLPGVSKGVEGGTDFFVRGGDADQNLVLLDGTTVYNTGHLFGFLSVFNPDVMENATLIKGAFPAYYGRRLSSILDIKTKEGIPERTEVAGNVGLISSRLTVRQPLKKDKLSIMLSGRRTYIDRVLAAANTETQLPYYFFDVNGKLEYRPNPNNKLFFSYYTGADILDYSSLSEDSDNTFNSNFNTRNNSQSLGWQRLLESKDVLEFSLNRTFYSYDIDNSSIDDGVRIRSGIEDYGFRANFNRYLSDSSSLVLGATALTHNISPSRLDSKGIVASLFPSSRSDGLFVVEGAVYGHYEIDISGRVRLNLGHRQSFAVSGSKFYTGFEPRIGTRWKLNNTSSLKASYTRMTQYMHRVSSSTVSLPVDLWYSVTEDIEPQSANQWVLGYVKTIPSASLLVDVEAYYKSMNNLTEYAEGTNLVLSTDFEEAILQGKGRSYGLETLVKREGRHWKGWISYSLSWSNRQFDQLNEGDPFPAKYDRRHNVSVVAQYDILPRLTLSAVWEFVSGSRFTPVIGQYAILNPVNSGIDVLNIYSRRNEATLSDAHRLDVGLIWKSKPRPRWSSRLILGVYNVYNRATPISISITQAEDGSFQYTQPGLFGLIPSISYSFKF